MTQRRQIRKAQRRQSGAALLIAIFALMLISVVAIALVVSQGTDSALAGNYRTSIGSYYAGIAGLEEARGRLLWKNPNCFVTPVFAPPNCVNSTFIPMAGSTLPAMALTDVRYILNPASGDTVDPTGGNPANYVDNEYQTEMGWPLSGAIVATTPSVSPVAGLPGPSYKWVRINVVTEHALNIDVNGDGVIDTATPLMYDPAAWVNAPPLTAAPSLIVPSTVPPSPTAVQALEITSLAVTPSGSRRLLQYVVAPLLTSTVVTTQPNPGAIPPNLNFPAALTLDGNNVTFTSANYRITGQDESPACSPPPPTFMVPAIGYTNSADASQANIVAGATPGTHFVGFGGFPPPAAPSPSSFRDVSDAIRIGWRSPTALDSVIQDITKGADVVINGNTTGAASLTPLGMSPAKPPLTIVVNGNLDMTSWPNVGYGLLVVTGKLTYDASMTWEGIILVVGRGKVDFVSNGFGGGIDGAMLVAETRNSSNQLLVALGAASFRETGGAGNYGRGLNYNSCLINSAGAAAPLTYKVLSFREIPTN